MEGTDPFRPLAPEECETAGASREASTDEFEPLLPPEGSTPPAEHHELGRYSHHWAYFGADGEFQGYQCRFEIVDDKGPDKTFRPLRYGRWLGREGWHWKGWGDGRPLYGLRELLANPDAPVLVTEGEKAADAAAAAMPGCAVVSPMNGARSPHKTDWSAVAGRGDQEGPGTGRGRYASLRDPGSPADRRRRMSCPQLSLAPGAARATRVGTGRNRR